MSEEKQDCLSDRSDEDKLRLPLKLSKAPTVFSSFGFAWEGLCALVCRERNFRIHILISLAVIAMASLLSLPPAHWALLILCIGWMLSVEALNSAMEALVDLVVGDTWHPMAKLIKDIAAAACILTAATCAIVGLIILGPAVWILVSTRKH